MLLVAGLVSGLVWLLRPAPAVVAISREGESIAHKADKLALPPAIKPKLHKRGTKPPLVIVPSYYLTKRKE